MRLTHVLLTAVNIIRAVHACVHACVRTYARCYPCARAHTHTHTHANPPPSVSHASRTLNSRDTRTTCAALDEPKQTSASESETRRGRDREKRGEDIGRGRRIGRGEKQTNKPASTCINTFKSNHDIGQHRRNDARTIVGDSFSVSLFLFTLACLASNCKYSPETKARITAEQLKSLYTLHHVVNRVREAVLTTRARRTSYTEAFVSRKNTKPGDLN